MSCSTGHDRTQVSTICRPPLVSRADLVRMFAGCPAEQQVALAGAAGWDRLVSPAGSADLDSTANYSAALNSATLDSARASLLTTDSTRDSSAVDARPDIAAALATLTVPTAPAATWPSERRSTLIWMPVAHAPQSQLLVSQEERDRPGRLEWRERPRQPAAHQPLVDWSVLVPRLRSMLDGVFDSREVDVPRSVDLLAAGRWDRALPKRTTRRWGGVVQLILDCSPRLMPYFGDQERVERELRRLLGHERLEVYFGFEPDPGQLRRLGPGEGVLLPYRWGGPKSRVLVLGDLGALSRDEPDLVDRWAEFGRAITERGGSPLALVPCDLRRIATPLRRAYRIRAWGPRETTALDAEQRAVLSRRLLILVSFAVRVEPGLLRACRRLLSGATDPGLEADVWQNDAFVNRTSAAGELGPAELVDRLVREFERQPEAVRRAVLNELRRFRTKVGCEVYFEELARLSPTTRALVPASDWEDARAGWNYLRDATLRTAPEQSTPVSDFARRLLWRVTDETAVDSELGATVTQLRRHLYGSPAELAVPPSNRISVFQSGDELVLRGEDESAVEPPREPRDSRIVALRTRGGVIEVATDLESKNSKGQGESSEDSSARQSLRIAAGEVRRIACPQGERFMLRTDLETYELRPMERPTWADAYGRDQFGVWSDVEICGVATRWRWIPPGSFLMGSPESEPGHWIDESPRHWVTLTRAFWMLNTPCTQRLWAAVVGKNASRFQDPDRPVERVSWSDVDNFVAILNGKVMGLHASLPTEAQWEYACRAGSTAALYRIPGATGEITIRGTFNSTELDALAWYGGNSGVGFELDEGQDTANWYDKQHDHVKAGTRRVATKAPNAWGVFDQLGNVWEWCADGQREYSGKPECDPKGAAIGSRVIRGACWGTDSRGTRCAFRARRGVAYQNEILGFRLVRVHERS